MERAFFAALLSPLSDLPIRVLVPQAPERTTLVHGRRRAVPSWYDYDGDPGRFQAELERSEQLITRFTGDVEGELGLRPRKRILLGFSQGGYCGAYVALRRPDLFGGMVISGARVKTEILEAEIRRAVAHDFAVLLCHGARDTSVGLQAARRSFDALRAGGLDAELRTFDSGHSMGRSQVYAIREWLEQRFGVE